MSQVGRRSRPYRRIRISSSDKEEEVGPQRRVGSEDREADLSDVVAIALNQAFEWSKDRKEMDALQYIG